VKSLANTRQSPGRAEPTGRPRAPGRRRRTGQRRHHGSGSGRPSRSRRATPRRQTAVRRPPGKAKAPHPRAQGAQGPPPGAFSGILYTFSRIVAAPLALPLDAALMGAIGASVLLFSIHEDLPSVDALQEFSYEEPLRIYSADGSLMAEFGVQRRRAVDFEDIPPDLVNAFLAAEDSRFYDHAGIDAIGSPAPRTPWPRPVRPRRAAVPSPCRWRATSS
jgi:hypothetical protein